MAPESERTRWGKRRTEGNRETHCLNGSMTIAATYVRTSASPPPRRATHCYVSELSSSRRRLLVPTGIALLDDSRARTGGDNISATSIRRSHGQRRREQRTTLGEREKERQRERNAQHRLLQRERERQRDGENERELRLLSARRVLPALSRTVRAGTMRLRNRGRESIVPLTEPLRASLSPSRIGAT